MSKSYVQYPQIIIPIYINFTATLSTLNYEIHKRCVPYDLPDCTHIYRIE